MSPQVALETLRVFFAGEGVFDELKRLYQAAGVNIPKEKLGEFDKVYLEVQEVIEAAGEAFDELEWYANDGKLPRDWKVSFSREELMVRLQRMSS